MTGANAVLHNCELGDNQKEEGPDYFGEAIGRCWEDNRGRLWCDNDEYITQVNFCPFCGYKAVQQVTWKPQGAHHVTPPSQSMAKEIREPAVVYFETNVKSEATGYSEYELHELMVWNWVGAG